MVSGSLHKSCNCPSMAMVEECHAAAISLAKPVMIVPPIRITAPTNTIVARTPRTQETLSIRQEGGRNSGCIITRIGWF